MYISAVREAVDFGPFPAVISSDVIMVIIMIKHSEPLKISLNYPLPKTSEKGRTFSFSSKIGIVTLYNNIILSNNRYLSSGFIYASKIQILDSRIPCENCK